MNNYIKNSLTEMPSMVRVLEEGELQNTYKLLRLTTEKGDLFCRYYHVPDTRFATILVGGIGGDWDSPGRELYPRICFNLRKQSIASLHLQYRDSSNLSMATYDVFTALRFLHDNGISRVALIGHSFGGAAVIQAASQDESVKAVVTLSTQSFGTNPVRMLGPRCGILLIHGMEDEIIPHGSSGYVHGIAKEPKKLIYYPHTKHNLEEAENDVYNEIYNWITRFVLL